MADRTCGCIGAVDVGYCRDEVIADAETGEVLSQLDVVVDSGGRLEVLPLEACVDDVGGGELGDGASSGCGDERSSCGAAPASGPSVDCCPCETVCDGATGSGFFGGMTPRFSVTKASACSCVGKDLRMRVPVLVITSACHSLLR